MSAIRVELELKDGSFVSGMLRAGQSLDSFRKELARLDPHFRKVQGSADGTVTAMNRVDGASRGALSTFRDLSVIAGATALAFQALTGNSNGLISGIIKANAEMEKLKFQMIGMSTASDPVREAAENVDYLREAATKAPFSIRELTSTFVKLKAAGIDDTRRSMEALTDGIAAFGGSDEQLHRVTLGITQMAGKGVIQMEEMRQQLGESMPTAMRLMARSMGVSVGELVDAIATGKLEARSALKQFTEELDRAYGGSAIRMMQTFSGQVTQMNANLQRLATDNEGELYGFFEDLKGYLQEFNDFLASPQAKAAANELGATLRVIAGAMTDVIRVAYDFRTEIKIAVMALGGLMVVRQVGLAMAAFSTTLTLAAGRLGTVAVAANGAAGALAMAGGGGALKGLAGSLLGIGAAGATGAAGVAAFGGTLASALAVAAPWLAAAAALGAGVYYLGNRFGWLGDKTRDAYEELRKYGAESRDLAEQILNDREKAINDQIEDLKTPWINIGGLGERNRAENNAEIAVLQEELRQLREDREVILAEALDRELQVVKQRIERETALRTADANQKYSQEQTALDDWYQTTVDAAAKNGEDIAEITEEYHRKQLLNQKDLLAEEMKVRDDQIKKYREKSEQAAAVGNESESAVYAAVVAEMVSERVRLGAEMSRLISDGANVGMSFLSSSQEDPAKLIEKGRTELSNLREEISGMEANIAGASGEYAKLLFRIQRGDYGRVEDATDEFRELTDQLKEATKQKEAFDAILSGRNALSSDLESLKNSVRDQELELEARRSGKELNEAEKLIARVRAGYYEGLGPIENIRKAVMNLTGVTNTQGVVAEEAARVMFQETFGQKMINQVNLLRDAIFGVTGALQGMGGAASGFSLAGGLGMPGMANIRTNVDGGILDLIAQRESGGDYNATLDNGRWTGGPRNLTQMTLREVRALQDTMRTPENRALYGNGKGSSALGRYQIVGQTLQGLMEEMGLTGDELYDEGMQDEMAKRLFARRGANPAGLREEWAGLKGVSDADIMAAIARSTTGPTKFNATMRGASTTGGSELPTLGAGMNTAAYDTMIAEQQRYGEEAIAAAEQLDTKLREIAEGNADLDLADGIKDLRTQILDANKPLEEMGKNYEKVAESIRSGALGDDRNIESARYKEILALAKQLDEAETKRDERKKAGTEAERQLKQLEEERAEIQRQIAEAQARAADPDYLGTSDDLAKLNAQFDEYLKNIELASGKNSQAYKDALAYKQQYLADANALQSATIVADMAAEKRELEDSLLTERQLRQVQLQRELALVDQRAEQLRAAGASEVEITRVVEEQKAAIRAKYAQESMSPIGQQMKEWSDLQGNLEQSSAKWMDSAASGIAGLITGTGDLKSAINGIVNDIANMGVRFLMSQMMPAGGKAGAGKAAGAAGKVATGGKMPFPVKHSGGIAGVGGGSTRMASIAAFAGAKRFHTGGIIGGGAGFGLRKNEVPIIAEKGEGVFTSDQMKALGGFASSQSFQINAPVSVNGSAGTPEQNADLARKITESMESSMRMVVMDEMRKQTRPGNMMNTGAR